MVGAFGIMLRPGIKFLCAPAVGRCEEQIFSLPTSFINQNYKPYLHFNLQFSVLTVLMKFVE